MIDKPSDLFVSMLVQFELQYIILLYRIFTRSPAKPKSCYVIGFSFLTTQQCVHHPVKAGRTSGVTAEVATNPIKRIHHIYANAGHELEMQPK